MKLPKWVRPLARILWKFYENYLATIEDTGPAEYVTLAFRIPPLEEAQPGQPSPRSKAFALLDFESPRYARDFLARSSPAQKEGFRGAFTELRNFGAALAAESDPTELLTEPAPAATPTGKAWTIQGGFKTLAALLDILPPQKIRDMGNVLRANHKTEAGLLVADWFEGYASLLQELEDRTKPGGPDYNLDFSAEYNQDTGEPAE